MDSTTRALPQETIHVIVDSVALDEDSKDAAVETLKTLSLTSRIFLHQARSHLFRSLRITTKNHDTENLRDAFDMLKSNDSVMMMPSLAGYVREVEVWYDFARVGEDCGIEEDADAVKEGQGLLSKMFSMFSRLEVLNVSHFPMVSSGADEDTSFVHWGRMRRDLRKALYRLATVRSECTLQRFRMSGFRDVPAQMLLSLRSLDHLDIPCSTSISRVEEDQGGAVHVPQWRLRYLVAASGFDVLSSWDVHASGLYSWLTHLHLVVGTMDSNAVVWDIINSAAKTLVALKLEYVPRHHEPKLVYECLSDARSSKRRLPNCPRLQYLSLEVAGGGESASLGFPPSTPASIPSLLSTIMDGVQLPSLEAFSAGIDIAMSLNQVIDFPYIRIVDPILGWDRLDEILSDVEGLPVLRAVRVTVNPELVDDEFGYPVDDEDEEVFQDVTERRAREDTEATMRGVAGRVKPGLFSTVASSCDDFSRFAGRFWDTS